MLVRQNDIAYFRKYTNGGQLLIFLGAIFVVVCTGKSLMTRVCLKFWISRKIIFYCGVNIKLRETNLFSIVGCQKYSQITTRNRIVLHDYLVRIFSRWREREWEKDTRGNHVNLVDFLIFCYLQCQTLPELSKSNE